MNDCRTCGKICSLVSDVFLLPSLPPPPGNIMFRRGEGHYHALYYHPLCSRRSILPHSVLYITTLCALYYHPVRPIDTIYYHPLCPRSSKFSPFALYYHPICSTLPTSAISYNTQCSSSSILPPSVIWMCFITIICAPYNHNTRQHCWFTVGAASSTIGQY